MIKHHSPNYKIPVPYFPIVTGTIFSKTKQKKLYFAFTDLEKAFDLVI